MKRLLLILLMLMLSLQTVWAVTDAYCADSDEQRTLCAADCARSAPAADRDTDPSAAPHGDCTLCHLGHSVAPTAIQQLPLPQANLPAMTAPAGLSSGGIAARPERPKWLARA